ncbi:hypothetical protein C1N63_10425 [Pantoea ananatis]|nr:hypothetical protein C1N63_10425 [Pantoea ananatis]
MLLVSSQQYLQLEQRTPSFVILLISRFLPLVKKVEPIITVSFLFLQWVKRKVGFYHKENSDVGYAQFDASLRGNLPEIVKTTMTK